MIQNITSISEVGLYRKKNQDKILALHTDNVGLFAVADGMGGHYRGELASQTAVELLLRWWEGIEGYVSFMSFIDIVKDLEKKVKEINGYIFQMYREIGQRGGTTLCLLFIRSNAYAVMNIGDSRLYKAQGRSCMQLTTDDVWENQPYVRQTMCESEIRNNPSCGKLVQAVGFDASVRISVRTGSVEKRTCFLLCSDGIYKYCESLWMMSRLKKVRNKKDMDVLMEKIRKTVYENGAKDNLSMIIITLN